MSYLHIYWVKYRLRFFITVFFLGLEALADLLQPALMAVIVDHGVAQKDLQQVIRIGSIMLFITLLGAVCACIRNVLSVSVSQNFAKDLREDLYKKIQSLSIKQLDSFGSATLMTRLTNDVTRVQTFANGMMRIMMKAPLVGVGSIIMAIRMNLRLSVILFAMAPVIAVLILMNMRFSFPYYNKVQHALDKLNLSLQEYLRGIRVIKIFNRMTDEFNRFQINNRSLGRLSSSATKISNFFSSSINLTVNGGIVAILWFGGIGVNNGSVQVGSVIAFTNYMMQILFAMMMVNNAFNMLVRAQASAKRIGTVMNEPDTKFFPSNRGQEIGQKGSLVFDHVFFNYSESAGEWILQDIDFELLPGQTLGIVGPVASGKSTLAELILRFYDPVRGSIIFDGCPLTNFSEKDLRSRVALVFQESLLFSGTVLENIRWGNQQAEKDEIIRAAQLAEADSFITQMPNGYDSVIGQGGVNLSGGQKQRISLARALVRKPELLILDDATSAVDALTERRVRNNLKKIDSGVSLIQITHRVASLIDADRIIVLNNGSVQASGRHVELLKTSPYYREICQSQWIGEGRAE